jgi:hypothetical protein
VKINPLLRWFGSKWQAGKRYPAPRHPVIVEPFAGGAGYSLNHVDRQVFIWDTDPHLQVLWPWLIGPATSADVLAIPVDVPEGTDIRTLGLTPGQATLMKSWQRTNNVGDCWTVSAWNGKPGLWSVNTRARVAEELNAIKHWQFIPIRNWELDGITYFVDPPYVYNYRYREREPFNFRKLAEQVNAVPSTSQVIVCEAVCTKTGKVPGWLPFRQSHESVTSRRKATQSHHSKELIYER